MPEKKIRYMSEIDIKAESDKGSPAFLNDVIAGKVTVGTPDQIAAQNATPVEPIAVAAGAAGELVTTPEPIVAPVEPVVEPVVTEPVLTVEDAAKYKKLVDENEQIIENLRVKRQADKDKYFDEQKAVQTKMTEYESSVASMQDEVAKLNKQLEEQKKVVSQEPKLVIEEDEEDEMAATQYSINTRKLLNELQKEQGTNAVSDPKLDETIATVKGLIETNKVIEEQNKLKATEEARVKAKSILFDDIRTFQGKPGNECFQTQKDPKLLTEDFRIFRSEISEFVKSNQPREINEAIDSLINGMEAKDNEFRERAKKEGVKIPDEIDKFLMIAEINDRKNGRVYNKSTGNLDIITDSSGKPARQASLEDALKLTNYWEKINEARRDSAKKYQQKVKLREDTAVTLDNQKTASAGEDGKMSPEDIKKFLDMPESAWRNNPELQKQVAAAYNAAGVQLPKRGGQF